MEGGQIFEDIFRYWGHFFTSSLAEACQPSGDLVTSPFPFKKSFLRTLRTFPYQ